MCATCGCGTDDVRVSGPGAFAGQPEHPDHDHVHPHDHDHHRDHQDDHPHRNGGHDGAADQRTHTVELEQRILAKNDRLAEENRRWLSRRGIRSVNLMSSPGAGKTSLLERTIAESDRVVSVIEGDQETAFDAERIRAAGARAVQVNTGSGCHLDAAMVRSALDRLRPAAESLVIVENVGNLVCPALFDLGEDRKVVVISVTEGDDKPLKYPHMFAAADLVLVNKVDLLPYVDFDVTRLSHDARNLNPGLEVLPISVRTGENLVDWYAWLENLHRTPSPRLPHPSV